jgi:hypothetical protein
LPASRKLYIKISRKRGLFLLLILIKGKQKNAVAVLGGKFSLEFFDRVELFGRQRGVINIVSVHPAAPFYNGMLTFSHYRNYMPGYS